MGGFKTLRGCNIGDRVIIAIGLLTQGMSSLSQSKVQSTSALSNWARYVDKMNR